jgi:uncharacterized membrane protein
VVAVVHGEGNVPDDEVIRALQTGIERTFDQDPTMALRVLADIALRALSPGVNDPTTAVQSLDEIDSLLRQIVRRDLAVDTIEDSDGRPRVQLRLPTWDDYVAVALDEVIASSQSSPQVGARVDRLLAELAAIAPEGRAEPLLSRLR